MTAIPRPTPAPRMSLRAAHALLTVLAMLLYAVGWVPGVVVTAARWCVDAVRLGWDDAVRHRGDG